MTVRSLFDRTFHDTVKDGTNDEGGPSGGVSWEGGGVSRTRAQAPHAPRWSAEKTCGQSNPFETFMQTARQLLPCTHPTADSEGHCVLALSGSIDNIAG